MSMATRRTDPVQIRLASIASAAVVLTAALGACTWVKPTTGGTAVHVVYEGKVTGCRDAGSISVSVADKIAFYHRSELKVRDELELLARNQAASIPADTIQATSEPQDGAQTFAAYVCGTTRVRERAAEPNKDGAQTFPVKEH
jgi:hypothetical protein